METEFTQDEINHFKDELKTLQVNLIEDIARSKESTKPVKLDQQAVGRVSRIDAIQQQQMQTASFKRLEGRLQAVERALSSIDKGNYGLCLKCEEQIAKKRLLVRPEASLCIRCSNES